MPKKLHYWVILSQLLLSLLMTLVIFTAFKSLPAKLPLFYSVAWGEKQLATHQEFLIIPTSISIIALFNLIISWQLHSSQSFFKKVLLISSMAASFILTIAFAKIVLSFI